MLVEWPESLCSCHVSSCCYHQGQVSLVAKSFQNKARAVPVKINMRLNLSWKAEIGSFRQPFFRAPCLYIIKKIMIDSNDTLKSPKNISKNTCKNKKSPTESHLRDRIQTYLRFGLRNVNFGMRCF